jgi:hypothetical protein
VIETLVVCTLLGLLTTGMVMLFASYGKHVRVSQLRRDYIDQGQKGMVRLEGELTNSSANYLSLGTNYVIFPSAQLSLSSPLVLNSDGKLVWQRWICYAVDTSTSEFYRGESAIATPSTNPGAAPALSTFKSSRKRVSFPALSFSVAAGTASGLYVITMGVGDKTNQVTLTSQIGVRN